MAGQFWRGALVAAVLVSGFSVAGCAVFGSSSASPSSSGGGAQPSVTGLPVTPVASASPTVKPKPRRTRAAKVLAGKIVGIDPGHNGLNHTDPGFLDQQVFNGRTMEDCDTTGTQTAAGYSEAEFNFNVATYLKHMLRKEGAKVVLTRQNNDGLGPCVDKRSSIINNAHANVAIDIHADGGPVSGRGFTVLEPIRDGPNDNVIASSDEFGTDVHTAFLKHTPFGVSDYYGTDGYINRDDLAGLNLTTVPKVLIECGNMPNPQDAALLTSAKVQREIAGALNDAIVRFLTGHWPEGTG